MKDVLEVLRQKEAELALVNRHVVILRLVVPLLAEPGDVADFEAAVDYFNRSTSGAGK
jgi:hypothetical protein